MKWVADFRDPWTEISYYRHLKLSKAADRKHRKLEKSVFQNADITIATSFTDAKNFSDQCANAVCITNGFDTEAETKVSRDNVKFTVSYIGVLEQLRNPAVLWTILSELVKEKPEFAEHFELRFTGRIDDHILKQLQNSGLSEFIKNIGYVEHAKSVEEMRASDLLVLTNFPNAASKGIIPGKIFEYLSTGNKIISFGPENADVETILNQTKAGKHFLYSDEILAKTYILQVFEEWKNGSLQNSESSASEMYSRRNLTRQLVEIL